MQAIVTSDSIYFRQLGTKDATARYCSWLNNPQVNKFLDTKKATVASLRQYIKDKNSKPDCIFLGIFDKTNHLHIGNIKLEPIDFVAKKAIVGILIGDKDYWGRGVGTKAMRLVIKYAFKDLKLNQLELNVKMGHQAAIKLYQKVGFAVTSKHPRAHNLTMTLIKTP